MQHHGEADLFRQLRQRLLHGEALRLVRRFGGGVRRDLSLRAARAGAVVEMDVSTLPASAGFGEALDNNLFERKPFPASSVPAGASFAVRVSGDSMEPVLHDGQYAWVEECTRLNPGEVGLFVVDGEGFIKVYDEQEPEGDDAEDFTDSEGIRHPQPVLVSCNEDYAPKVIGAGMNFRIVGRVLNA